jgi:hypothetical protein
MRVMLVANTGIKKRGPGAGSFLPWMPAAHSEFLYRSPAPTRFPNAPMFDEIEPQAIVRAIPLGAPKKTYFK